MVTTPNSGWLAAGLAGLFVCAAAGPAFAGSRAGRVEFEVMRGNEPFGRQGVTVTEQDGALVAEGHAELRAALGPVVLFNYTQRCSETWRNGALEALDCSTRKNGRTTTASGATSEGGIRVRGSAGALTFPASTLPTSWWTRPPLTARAMINTENGARLPVRVTLVGRETRTIGGVSVGVDHIRVQGTVAVDLWYDDEGHWVGCEFTASGQHVTFRLVSPRSQAPA